jgi:deoxyadenosine/deoxycytidine kinase
MYIVEGNIGAGKSTFLKLIEQRLPHISIALEPLHNWQRSEKGQSLLNKFYSEPKRWAYTLETLTMMCRVREHVAEQQHTNPNRIMERSIYSGHYCFAQNGYEHDFMSELEWAMYNQQLQFLIPNKCRAPHGFIYLRVEPEIAFERIKKRNREDEKNITLEYLRQIHDKHESFLVVHKKANPYIAITPVLELDCNQEFESDEHKLQEHMLKVQEFMILTQQSFKPAKLDLIMMRQEAKPVELVQD